MQAGGLITAQEATAPRADPRKPRAAGAGHDHRLAVRRAAADPARRGRAGASPYPIGVALHHRGPRRLYRGRRRAHRDAAGRFRDHALLDLARPRQRDRRADGLARRARHPDRQIAERELCRAGARRSPGGDPARRRQRRALRQQSAAGRLEARGQDLAGLQLSLCAHPRGARRACAATASPTPITGTRCATSTRRAASYAMPTIGTFIQLLPSGFATAPYRSTDGTVYVAVEGSGREPGRRPGLRAGGRATSSSCRAGCRSATVPTSEAVLFSYSDRPVQEKLGLWREQRGNAS